LVIEISFFVIVDG